MYYQNCYYYGRSRVTFGSVVLFIIIFSLSSIGVITLVSRFLRTIRPYVKARFSAARYGAGKGAWAVVTNAASTQGSERAVRLAAEGFNVLAIGRDADLLASLLRRMQSAYDLEDNTRQAKTMVVDDATELSPERWDALTAELKELDIGVLALHGDAEASKSKSGTDVTEKAVGNASAANVATLSRLVSLVLPGMAQREHAVIVHSGPALGTSSAFGVEMRSMRSDMLINYAMTSLDYVVDTPFQDHVRRIRTQAASASRRVRAHLPQRITPPPRNVNALMSAVHGAASRGYQSLTTAQNVLSEKLVGANDGPAPTLQGGDDTAGTM